MRIQFAPTSRILLTFVASITLHCLYVCASAQDYDPPAQITQSIDETKLTVLRGNTHPEARSEFDLGVAPATLPMNRMLLVLKRSEAQEAALRKLLDDQHVKASPKYHQWLTPEAFGTQFGPSGDDIQRLTAWLRSHGFQVAAASKGRTVLEFSGSASQVQEALHTSIHKYIVNGEQHWANASDPQIPAAFTQVVAGIDSLHDFPKKPLHHTLGVASRNTSERPYALPRTPKEDGPLYTTNGFGCGLMATHCYAVAPYDLATIYNILPLWNASTPIDGTGQTIAIVGQSDIYPQDFSGFRSLFGLPTGTLNIIYNGIPPIKLASQGDELESDLDVEWSGAVAKGATIDFVASASTNSTAGVDLSAEYIVDNNLAPILSESYGACELDMGTAGNQFYYQLWQQASAEGITVFVATGDSGATVCDRGAPIAIQGLSVNGIASTPYNVAVGGTEFDDLQDTSTYWTLTNNSSTLQSAISYIPERTWNDTCTSNEYFSFTGVTTAEADCNDSTSAFWPNFLIPVGGSGGASNCTTSSNQTLSSCSGGYAKPSWQSGIGVPQDSERDVPDVSLFAADGMNASFYIACESDIYGGCEIALGGTSFSAPEFAGIMALVNQKMQSRQGLANYVFYPLAAQPGASCDSSGTKTSSCIFNDITTGTIATPCTTGSPNCVTNTANDANGVLSGYSTTPGYDLATGLGSVNVANLVNNWGSVSFQPTTSTLSLSPTTLTTHGSPVNVSITVAPTNGTGSPSGLASLLTSTGQVAGSFTVSNGAVGGTTDLLPGGTYTVTAHYAGDGTFGASDSSPGVAVTVNLEPSTTTVQSYALDNNGSSIPFSSGPYGGSVVYLSASVAGESGQGIPTGTVSFTQTGSGTTTNLSGSPYNLNSQAFAMVPLLDYNYWAYTPGTYTIGATYNGDSSFQKSTASTITFTVTQAQANPTVSSPGCTLVGGVCSANPGDSLRFFATVNYTGAAFNKGGIFINLPTGTVTFYSNGIALGPPSLVDSSITPPVADVTTTQLQPGPDNITAQYSGDANFSGSTSAPFLVAVGETFAISANPSVINIASPGQSGATTLTFTAQNGFTGSGSLLPSMCNSLPPESSCSFSPAAVTFTSTATSIPVMLTISTTGASSHAGVTPWFTRATWAQSGVIAACFVVSVFVLLLRNRPKRASVFVAFPAVALLVSALSCGGSGGTGGSGGGGSSGGGGGGNSSGTPVGNYSGVTVTVTINGTTQTLNNLGVNVQ